jgi:hypothetical protein
MLYVHVREIVGGTAHIIYSTMIRGRRLRDR